MASIYLHKTGTYYAKYFNADGRRVSKNTGATSKREASRIAETFEADERDVRRKASQLPAMLAGTLEIAAREAAAGKLTLARAEELLKRMHRDSDPNFREVSLGDYWQEWIASQKRHVTASTATGYTDDYEIFSEALGKRAMQSPIREITKERIEAAMDKARTNGRGKGRIVRRASTINKALSSLRRVMESAVASGLATSNPAKQARTLGKVDSQERAPFTAQEVRAMMDHKDTSDEWRGAILLAAHTGLRLRDVLTLTAKNMDGTRLVIVPAKTARMKKVVTVPLTPPCMTWIGERKGAFFPSLCKLPSSNASMQFRAIMSKAGVPREIELPGGITASRSFHSLRHSFISWLAEADIHADVRQKLAGHSTSKMHAIYAHHDEALDRAVAALPKL